MRFKVNVDAKKVAFFKELLNSLNFVTYEEERTKDSEDSISKDGEELKVNERSELSAAQRKQKKSNDLNSIENRKKSLEDIRKAMKNIDKLRDSL